MSMHRRKFLTGTAAAIAAGAFSRPALAEDPIGVASIHDLSGGLDIYGKPMVDALTLAIEEANAAGGLLGRRGLPTLQRFEVSPRLYFVLLVPDLEIRTSIARKLLPSKISHAAAVANCANACAITAAFTAKDYEKLRGAFADYLHQPFRGKLISFLPGVTAGAEKAGALGAFLSGSGSTICAITLQHPDRVAAAMKRAARSSLSRTIITRADNGGAQVLNLKSEI